MERRWQGGGLAVGVLALVLVLTVPGRAWGQDAHYWTRQFGTRAWLLGGAVIGSALDISAVYYNPAALALVGRPEIQLTGNVFELTRLTVQDEPGRERDLATTRLVGSPSLLAGELRLGFLGRVRLAYSLLARHRFEFRIENDRVATGRGLPGPPGLEVLSTDVELEQNVSEYWAGLTVAYPLGEHLAIGLTPYVAVRNQRTRFQVLTQGFGGEGVSLVSIQGRELRYLNLRLLAKVGLSYQWEPWGLGVTVTTPGLSVWGRGAAGVDRTTVWRVPEPGADTPNEVLSVFQDRVSARYHSPLSVGLGASRQFGRTTLYLSAEWFDRVAPFDILDPERFRGRSPEEVGSGGLRLGLAPVVNAGVGLEQRLGEQMRGYVGFHTDFSAAKEARGIDAAIAEWDLYHTAAGVYFTLGRASFTLGGNVAVGSRRARGLIDFLSGAGLSAPAGTARVRIVQATLIVGASVQLARLPPAPEDSPPQ